ncbi:MAG: hypothetical protein PHT98_13335, partial [Kiritimatiellae bacterium]|nr:hypothetical protein [Kiritimatiellia bacterium]MDD4443067.1 hypothetical protein [Kiritimatiellia bacterium]
MYISAFWLFVGLFVVDTVVFRLLPHLNREGGGRPYKAKNPVNIVVYEAFYHKKLVGDSGLEPPT